MSNSGTQLRTFGVGFLLSFGAFGVGQVVVALAALAFAAVGIDVLNRPALFIAISTVMLQGVTFGGIALGYLTYRNLGLDFIHAHVPSLRDLGMALVGFVVLFGALQIISQLIQRLGLQSAQNTVVDMASGNPDIYLLLIPLSFLLIGPGEELLYRGLIQGLLRKTFRPARAIVLASALFAVVHVFSLSGAGKLVSIGTVFTLSLILGILYEYTDNLVVPILVHGAYDAVLFSLQYLMATGQIPS
ncbi:type II CAAX endopeptidase family protein [Haladaptatus sp. DYF46]|uniref:CPBP family intramembrane glutamic endopeptidase n=1 Tax=Haladaptatus sp. DYF46 TaxID=2886041 RepID=UPI001E569B93|nr:type II CAAX endopeptidase family protein [Haladaptatus sp. DYF46]